MKLGDIDWNGLLQTPEFLSVIRILVIAVFGLALLYTVSFAAGRVFSAKRSPHIAQLVKKLIFYTGTIAIVVSVMLELGFDLRGVLATAGVLGVAVGFAAQTSLGNLISGLFLVGERPFHIGDLVRISSVLGVVESIDLLSIKIRTLDNLFVRIPNEAMLKEPLTTVTRYPIRRMDLDIGVAYKEDVVRVMAILKELGEKNVYALDDPEPLILFDKFGDSALQFKFGVWFEKSNFINLRNSILRDVKERFDKEGIEIPFPHITVYRGSESEPFEVDLRQGKVSTE
jgi:small-conductance mechanosensitive channel